MTHARAVLLVAALLLTMPSGRATGGPAPAGKNSGPADPLATLKTGRWVRLEGEIPSPINPKPGCRFASRCPRKVGSICETEPPPQQQAGDGHMIFCHIPLAQLQQAAPVLQVAS